mmetsp:Transcript_9222/g.19357  ORF Transcript_9222/g.19357 Transcript_9222/m.19357 type:complete len:406 (-) Transcript_9222:63-1280(-)|eukprot:CAMPEP_0201127152 /NCGR_PEP_ID=MMETSP0850-20130426/29014_1 /ASSEMBLY_ACC=CAM_ASM_000622 /TAXON_ID=183588 /ORGANISM="Pseudo-nitzschia fraudulenta, Strain WWA7" /LENGTH=405 /DNA_ID=CAMNT_0047395885 /DNA_START=171 /DNA_END=1388 /DNA_ORIENTATION=+
MNSLFRFDKLFLILLVSSSNAFNLVTHSSSPSIPASSSSSLHVSSFSSDDLSSDGDNQHRRNEVKHGQTNSRHIEFADLGSLEQSSERKRRIQQEQEDKQRFVKYGDDLWNMRQFMDKLSRKLLRSINDGDREKEEEIRAELRQVEHQDPDLVYRVELEQLQKATSEGREEDARQHSMIASAARSNLPQYNLDGLWVGKYGQHGYEMINVTYHGDLLIAYKVTGDKNVPRGEITFQVDLDPLHRNFGDPSGDSSSGMQQTVEPLQPISLTAKAAKKWGTTQLPRHKGLGQVAEAGFKKNQWMEGQLIIIGEEYFSFAWVPIEQQIFFGRPSPELALKMLRESGASSIAPAKSWKNPPTMDANVKDMKDYINSCLEKTTETEEEELNGDSFSCIWTGSDTEECYFQ